MKKIIINSALAVIFSAAIVSNSSGQDLAVDNKNKQSSADLYTSADEFRAPVSTNDIDKKIVKNFQRTYGQVEAVRWFKADKGFGVSFKSAGIKQVVFYTTSGAEDSRIMYYFENKMPAHVKTLVKTNFSDFTISHVAEIQKGEVTAYLVKIQDSSTVKTVKVIGDEWEVTETLYKN